MRGWAFFCLHWQGLSLIKISIANDYLAMKLLLPSLLLLTCTSYAVQQEVSVQLASARTEYRTHDASAVPGFNIKFELSPAPGISLCDTEDLPPEIVVTDAAGTRHKASEARLYTEPNGKAYAVFSTSKRPTGNKLTVEGTLHINIAKELTRHAPVKVDLLQPSEITLGTAHVKVIPAAANSNAANKESNRLRRAEIELQYSNSLNIVRIARQWQPDVAPAPDFSQNVQFTTTINAESTTKTTTLFLVDVLTSPSLQISTCAEEKTLQIPIKFSIGLSEAVNLSPPTVPTAPTSAQP